MSNARPAGVSWRIGGLLALSIGTAALWLWHSWSLFPNTGWNDARLAPLFALKFEGAMYPGEFGAASTWMYGPLHLLLMWPATWTGSAFAAITTAGALNACVSLGAILLVCAGWPTPRPVPAQARLLAATLVILIWPAAAWLFLQADSTSVAVGLVANLALVRWSGPRGRWAAALLAAAALLGKQTSLAVPIAQVLWLAWREGPKAGATHAARLLGAGGFWGVLLVAGHDVRDLWFNLIVIPSRLPWTEAPAQRIVDLGWYLVVHATVPAIVWMVLRRQNADTARPLALPMLSWVCAWPLGLAAMLKIGGSINVLQGLQLWLPAGMVTLIGAAATPTARNRIAMLMASTTVALGAWRFAGEPGLAAGPDRRIYDEARAIAKAHPAGVWFPWHPMVTWFADGSRYHDEDGFLVRFLAGDPLTMGEARPHFPANHRATALRTGGSDWGIAEGIAPPDATIQHVGAWTIRTWGEEASLP